MSNIPTSWLIYTLERSHLVISMSVADVSQPQAVALRDGPDGWNILEIMCHVRDHQEIYFERVKSMIEEDHPVFPAHDRMAMIVENDYANQDLREVVQDFIQTRNEFIKYVSALDEEQWQRLGVHPLHGDVNVSVPTYHTIMHDVDHTEQIMRVLAEGKS